MRLSVTFPYPGPLEFLVENRTFKDRAILILERIWVDDVFSWKRSMILFLLTLRPRVLITHLHTVWVICFADVGSGFSELSV